MTEVGTTIRVRHVDDEPDFARLTARHLERENERLTVRTATTAEAALERLDDVDCVVSDYQLTETTGLDVFAVVRDRHPNLPFILFTDTGSEAVASEAITAGVTDYLIKGVVAEQYALLASRIVDSVERRRAERAAARTDRQLREIADHTPDVLWMFSADWAELQFINEAYETVFEHPIERVRDQPDAFLAAVHPADRDRLELAMERVSAGESVRVEYRIDTEGGEKWVESRADAIVEDGDVVRVVGFTRDITDRKRTERELATKNDQLERFASMVAHDLRNPWSVADGYLDLARADHDSDELATVADALDRMERIITDLLELARAGATVGERETVSLAAAAETTWAAVDHADATLRVDADDVTLLADPSRLAQVFENLYRNALEHGERGVTVTVGTFDDGFYVADDGPGIPDADREAVFESGYSTRETGTGFGLAIVREVTNAHGWTVRAVPGAEGGARFEFSDVEWA